MARPNLRHHHNVLLLCVLALFIVLGILAFKYLWVKKQWYGNTVQLQQGLSKIENANSAEDGKVLAITIATTPEGFTPLVKIPSALQKYIAALSTATGRDIVILDKNNKILADTMQSNVGTTYTYDNGVISKTLFDGVPRSFIEKSVDYPDGITETVVQTKDANGTIIGTLLISSSNIFK